MGQGEIGRTNLRLYVVALGLIEAVAHHFLSERFDFPFQSSDVILDRLIHDGVIAN